MKCVCPQKPYTYSGGFPDLRETERRRRRSRRKSAAANAHYQAGQPERRESQGTRLIHRAALTARPWHRLLSLANNAIQHHTAIVMLEWESHYCILNPKHHSSSYALFSPFFPRVVIFPKKCLYLVFISELKVWSLLEKKPKQQQKKLNNFFILFCTCGLRNNEIIMWASLTLMFRKWEELRGVVSAAVFGTILSLCMEDAKFSYTVPANLLPLILAFFSFLSFFHLFPFSFISL